MKIYSFIFGLVFFSYANAATKMLAPCDTTQLRDLEKTIQSTAKDYARISYLKNKSNKVVGFYAYESKDYEIYAEVCEYMGGDFTVASDWSYWMNNEASTNPATWTTGKTYTLAQDEGKASFKVLKASKDGKITAEFKVIGWEEEEMTIRKEIVTLDPK